MSKHPTTVAGFENVNGQVNQGSLGIAGTDHNQILYRIKCKHCRSEYAANGSDIHHRKCPQCQSGKESSGKWEP